jgi:uncharacterized membrane-anchored protein YjiN (DUF445 family)
MSLTITLASVAVIAAGVTLTVNQVKVNRVRSDKAKMMRETTELAQKLKEDEESANRAKARKEKREQEWVKCRQELDDLLLKQVEESEKRDLEKYGFLPSKSFSRAIYEDTMKILYSS